MALNMIYCDFIKFRFNPTSHNHFDLMPLFHEEIEKVHNQPENPVYLQKARKPIFISFWAYLDRFITTGENWPMK